MDKNILPFKIGEQYEKWEFSLEPQDKISVGGLDCYSYFKKLNFQKTTPDKIELFFSLDILELVLLEYINFRNDEFISFLSRDLSFSTISKTSKIEIYKCNLGKEIELMLKVNRAEKFCTIIYGLEKRVQEYNSTHF